MPVRTRVSTAPMALIVLAAGAGCTPPARRAARGDDGWGPSLGSEAPTAEPPDAPRDTGLPPERRPPWERGAELAELAPAAGRGPSEHLGGGYEVAVQQNALAAAHAAGPLAAPYPPGALLVATHFRPGSATPLGRFVMAKAAPGSAAASRDWEFVVIDARLRVVARGALAACARCHLEAPNDGVFGPPP